MVYLFAVLIAVVFWLFVEHLSKTQEFLRRPEDEQQRIRKGALWSIFGGLAIGCVVTWLMQNGITSWVRYLVILAYLLIWVGAAYFFWLAYVIGVRKDTTKIKKSNGKPFSNPQKYLNGFAITNAISGCAITIIAIAIPLMKMEVKEWGALLVPVLAIRRFVETRLEKQDDSAGS